MGTSQARQRRARPPRDRIARRRPGHRRLCSRPGQTGLLEARGGQLPGKEGVWLRTTDLATIDDEEFLFVRGRADDAINRGGFKIPPSVIEDALDAHPAVDEASAVALPDDRLGQVPAAAVTLLSPATEEELMEYLTSRLTRYQRPVAIKVVDQLPRTPSLKISRALVREHYFDGHSPHGAAELPAPRRQESTMTADERAGYGVLTDESFERSRRRIGIPLRINPAHITEVTADATRHFAYGYGDDNPLYCDPEYGKNTRWGGLIAPPNFTYCMGENAAPPLTPEQKELIKGDPFAGLGSYQAAMEFEYYRPLTAGDRCHVIRAQVGVADKPSRFGGRTAHVTHDFLYANGHGQILTIQRGTWINAERHSSRDRSGDKQPVTFDPYTDDQIAEIDAAYDAETRRGPRTRYFEDVEVGEEIQPRVKGPLVVTDLVVWHLGWGMQLTPPGAFGIARKIRRKAPGLYPPNARNIPDTVQRLHWDPARAHELGIPMSYDYGAMRETWLTHVLTDWMGDDGWLLRLRCQHRKFNYIGDTTWVRGKVVDKVQADGRNEVHLEVGCWNQRGEQTTPGSAVVLLPTRERAVELPAPPADSLEELLAVEIARHG